MPPASRLVPLLAAALPAACLLAVAYAQAAPATADGPGTVLPSAPGSVSAWMESLHVQFDVTLHKARDALILLVARSPLLLVAAGIVVLAGWVGGLVSRRLHWLKLHTRNPYLNGLIRTVVRTVIMLAGVAFALDLLGWSKAVGAILGSAGLVGLVIGFAFKDIAENYIAGLLLGLRRPFTPGDHVRIDSHEGKVVALTSRATILMTLDGNELRLPNSLVFKAVVLNFSSNPKRRFDFQVVIDTSQSIRVAHGLALEQIAGVEGVLADPGPSWSVQEYGPAGIVLRFFGWVDQRQSDLGKVRSEAIRRVKAEFARTGISLPQTVQHVVLARPAVPGDAGPGPAPEPVNNGPADTSVNRDIDAQLEEARQQVHADDRLLDTEEPRP